MPAIRGGGRVGQACPKLPGMMAEGLFRRSGVAGLVFEPEERPRFARPSSSPYGKSIRNRFVALGEKGKAVA